MGDLILYLKEPGKFIKSFCKWVIIASVVGGISGVVGTAFRAAVEHANVIWQNHDWLIFLLPVGGLIIVGTYKVCGMTASIGTDRIIGSVRAESVVPVRLGPLIFVSTFITHLLGGSAGREGAALQLGGSIASSFAQTWELNEKESI